MIVLPLFWDQYDNAQRVDELGFGVRLDTYGFEDRELRDAVDRLAADDDLRSTMAATGERIRGAEGTLVAADLIEGVGRRHRDRAASVGVGLTRAGGGFEAEARVAPDLSATPSSRKGSRCRTLHVRRPRFLAGGSSQR